MQPLDVGCFSPLKRAYGDPISSLIRSRINHITKLEFLPAFYAAYQQSITKDNTCASFQGAGLVPHDSEAVLSKLNVRLRTPPLPATPELWESQTPSNARKLGAQSTLVRDRIQRHQNSSPTSIIQSVDQLTRDAKLICHQLVLLRDQVSTLQTANEAASARKSRKRKRT